MATRPARASRAFVASALLVIALPVCANAQQILIDQGRRIDGMWMFPSALDESHWYYVPNQARLATGEQGQPQFSFLRYVVNRAGETSTQGITQAEGGGVLHFLVTYDTPPEQVKKAQAALASVAEGATLRGPVIFAKGRYTLVSSILLEGGEEEEEHVLATGNAPVMEGSQIALAFELPAERATLLQRSLEMDSPDISLVFEMTLEGLSDSFDADIIVNWEQVKKHEAWGVGADLPLSAICGALGAGVGAAAGAAAGGYGAYAGAAIGGATGALVPGLGGKMGGILDELHEMQAVEVRTRGESPNLQGLVDRTVTTLVELLFEPVAPEGEQRGQPRGAMGALADLGEDKDEFGRPMLPLVGISAGYRTRRIEKSGTTVVSLNAQETVGKVTTIVFNVGALHERHGDDPRFFKTVNLSDPAFEQREVHVGIDGAILPEFEAHINSVTTTLRKQHQNGQTTVQEIVVDRATFEREANDFRMVYGWNGDADRDAWLRYDYQTRWSFKGGGVYETGWTATDSNMIDLYAPYRRKIVRVLGDEQALLEQGVRAVVVNVEHDFFDGRRRERVRLRPDQPGEPPSVELTLPLEQREYDYTVTWIRGSGERLETQGRDSTGMIFVDELPAAAEATP